MPNGTFHAADYKAVALDLDGTMLNEGVSSPRVERVLSELAARGLEIIIVTGRSLLTVPRAVLALPYLCYAVTSSGAAVTDLRSGRVLSRRAIDTDTALAAISAMRAAGAAESVLCDTVSILSVKSFFAMRRYAAGPSKAAADDFMRHTKITFSPSALIKRLGRPVEKLNFYFKHSEACAAAASRFRSQFPLEAVSTMGYDLEVSAPGVNKAVGLQTLCEHLSIRMREIVALGDSANDIEMLRAVGYSVAMGNAGPDIKRHADYIAPSVDEDGAAAALAHLFHLNMPL